MKRVIAIVIVMMLVLAGCGQTSNSSSDSDTDILDSKYESSQNIEVNTEKGYSGLGDPNLLSYIEDDVYEKAVKELDSDKYLVENVSAVYVSKEYLEELDYNSQSNVYFGYSLKQLENELGEEKYVFTCNEKGETVVASYEKYDDTFDQIVKNVAIGTGVILVCVTVSVVSGGLGAPAVAMVFAMSAKSAAIAGASGAIISGAVSAAVTGYQTHDVEKTLKKAGLSASDGFKWGSITGALTGGVKGYSVLKGGTLNGLTMNEAAMIQKESGYPIDIIKQFHSVDEYEIYKKSNLFAKTINGKKALVRKIDLNFASEQADGSKMTNLELMKKGRAPIDPKTGKAYQLHHIGQKNDGSLAILTESEHQGNSKILNIAGNNSEIDRVAFDNIRKEFWKSFANIVAGGTM